MVVMFYQQDSDLYAPAHKVSIAHNCSQHTKKLCFFMSPKPSDRFWLILLAIHTLPYPPGPMLLNTEGSVILKRYHTLLCLLAIAHSVLSEILNLAITSILPNPHLTWLGNSLTFQGPAYESCLCLMLSWHFTLGPERTEHSLHITFVPGTCL